MSHSARNTILSFRSKNKGDLTISKSLYCLNYEDKKAGNYEYGYFINEKNATITCDHILVEDGYLNLVDVIGLKEDVDKVDYGKLYLNRYAILKVAYKNFLKNIPNNYSICLAILILSHKNKIFKCFFKNALKTQKIHLNRWIFQYVLIK